MKIGLALLNKNEEAAVLTVLPRIPKDIFATIFAVDGGSLDSSPDLISTFGIEVLSQESRGRGAAFALAFGEARKRELDALCFLSTDGNERPEDLKLMCDYLVEGADLVIGSRMRADSLNEEDSKFFKPRKWANLLFAAVAYWKFGEGMTKITDPINGYRGMTCNAWEQIHADAQGFNIEYQISIRSYKKKLRYREFSTFEEQRIGGRSGAKALPTTLALLSVLRAEWR